MTFLKSFKKGFRRFGENTSLILTTVLLLIVYLVAVGLTSIAARITGKNFLERGLDAKSKSYWNSIDSKKSSAARDYRQF